jgi:hypothetical protein
MTTPAVTATIVPLVPNSILPQPASAHTRPSIPPGYGVQEQCLPFTAASALGFLILSPIRFGLSPPFEVPPGSRAFRSPLDRAAADGRFADPRVFYVVDNQDCRFCGNAYEFEEGGGRWFSSGECSGAWRQLLRPPAEILILRQAPLGRPRGRQDERRVEGLRTSECAKPSGARHYCRVTAIHFVNHSRFRRICSRCCIGSRRTWPPRG